MAVDTNIIPLYSIVEIEGIGKAIALDSGGAIKGNKIDLLVATHEEAIQFGRKNLNMKVVKYGK